MGLAGTPRSVPIQGLGVGQCQHLADGDLVLVPLEYQRPAGAEHAETLGEPGGDVIAPCREKRAVLHAGPRGFAEALEVRRVEDDVGELLVGERQVPEVGLDVGADGDGPAVADLRGLDAFVYEQRAGVVRVEPHHAAAGGHVEDGRGHCSSPSGCGAVT